jgi:hypothetical protein
MSLFLSLQADGIAQVFDQELDSKAEEIEKARERLPKIEDELKKATVSSFIRLIVYKFFLTMV